MIANPRKTFTLPLSPRERARRATCSRFAMSRRTSWARLSKLSSCQHGQTWSAFTFSTSNCEVFELK
jgi:hypothetical protein